MPLLTRYWRKKTLSSMMKQTLSLSSEEPSNLELCYVPVRSTGDGNCLLHSASLALRQHESLAVEFSITDDLSLPTTEISKEIILY